MKLNSSRRAVATIAAALSLQLVGCAAPPPIRFHSLLEIETSARDTVVTPGFAVTLASVSIPAQVDQPQWLVRQADGTLSLLEQERWVAPLRAELQGALLDRWAQRWGGRPALVGSIAGSKEAPWRVSLDVTRWEAVPGREVRLESRWSAVSGVTTLNCRSVISQTSRMEDGAILLALAASHRRAVARLADEVASRIAAIQKGEPARCADAVPDAQAA